MDKGLAVITLYDHQAKRPVNRPAVDAYKVFMRAWEDIVRAVEKNELGTLANNVSEDNVRRLLGA